MLTDNNLFLVDFFIGLILGVRHHSCKHDISLICRDEPHSDLFCHTHGDNQQIAYHFLTLINRPLPKQRPLMSCLFAGHTSTALSRQTIIRNHASAVL